MFPIALPKDLDVIPAHAGGARSSGLVRTAALSRPGELALGRYVIHGEIASGGMASVYHGRLTSLGGFRKEVAIKRLHRHLARDPEFVSMFLDEARLAARVVHPNVVAMLDVVSSADETFLVMDYVPGVAFSQLLRIAQQRGERVPIGVATTVAVGMLRGLHAAHEAKDDRGVPLGIVHRDVSPQNVIVGTDGIPRLLDFGVAKAIVRLQTTRDGQVKGKSSYMAPEQVTGGVVTQKADIYAAAVVLWEALTGQRLYSGGTDANILFRVATETAPPPSSLVKGIPDALDAIVHRGMSRDPEARFASAAEMADALERRVGVVAPTRLASWLEMIAREALDERAKQIAAFTEAQAQEITPLAPTANSAPTGPTAGGRASSTAGAQNASGKSGPASARTPASQRSGSRVSRGPAVFARSELPTISEGSSERSALRPKSAGELAPMREPMGSDLPTRTLTAAEISGEISDPFGTRRRRPRFVVILALLFLIVCAGAALVRAHRDTGAAALPIADPQTTSAANPAAIAPITATIPSITAATASPAPTTNTNEQARTAAPTSASPPATPVVNAPATNPAPAAVGTAAQPRHRSRPAAAAATATSDPDCVPYAVDAKGHTHFNPKCL